MERGLGNLQLEEVAAATAPYLPLGDGDAIDSDNIRLEQLGYKQELSRTLSCVYKSSP